MSKIVRNSEDGSVAKANAQLVMKDAREVKWMVKQCNLSELQKMTKETVEYKGLDNHNAYYDTSKSINYHSRRSKSNETVLTDIYGSKRTMNGDLVEKPLALQTPKNKIEERSEYSSEEEFDQFRFIKGNVIAANQLHKKAI